MVAALHWLAWTGIAFGVAAIAALAIVVVPWSRVHTEAPLSDEVQARLLLGEDPAAIDRDLAVVEDRASGSDLHPDG
jgi:hypothetical protein